MENKFKQFLAQFNNKSVEVVDASNLYQCFDLAVAWLDFLGVARSFNHLYAYQIYTDATLLTKQNFDLIPNTPENVPLVGDIVVFSKAFNGTAGHVVIATGEGDTNIFKAFSQNDPTGSPSIVKTYNYKYVLGWLRYKYQSDISDALKECLRQHELLVPECEELKEQVKGYKKADETLKKQLNSQQDEIEQLKKDKNNLEKKLELLQTEMDTKLKKQELDWEKKLSDQEIRMTSDFTLKEKNYKEKIVKLEEELKKKEIVKIVKPEYNSFKDRLMATINIWFS